MHKSKIVVVVLTFVCLTIICSTSYAQTGTAGQAGEFLRFGVGARALAMGRAFTSIADDASAMYWNPAGIGQLDQINLGVMHSQLFLDTKYQFLGLASPLNFLNNGKFKHNIGFGFINLQTENFDGRNELNQPTGAFNTQQYAILLPYAVNFINSWGNFNIGIKPQLFSQSIQGNSGAGVGLDLGIIFQPLSPRKYTLLGFVPLKYLMPWRIGINYRMLSSVELKGENQDYPNSLNIGVSNAAFEDLLDLIIPRFDPFAKWPFKMILSYEYEKIFNVKRKAEHHLGSELRWRFGRSIITSVRLGYRFPGRDFENNFHWGFGFATDIDLLTKAPFVKGIQLDFSQINHPDLDNASQVYLTFKLGTWRNNVRNIKQPTKRPESDLLGLLSEYPFDDRVFEEEVGLDTTYKYIVAESLRDSSIADTFLVKRYDDFIGGLRKIDRLARNTLRNYTNIRFEGNKIYPRGTNRNEFVDIRKQYEENMKELAKEKNYESLKLYLKVLLVLGDSTNMKAIVTDTKHRLYNKRFQENRYDRNYFLAYATKTNTNCDSLTGTSPKEQEKLFMKFTKAVVNEDINIVDNLLSEDNAYYGIYEPFPLIADMILVDDLMFLKAYLNSDSKTPDQLIKMLMKIFKDYPQSDIGKAISALIKKIEQKGYQRNQFSIECVRLMWKKYKNAFNSNRVLNQEIFENILEEAACIEKLTKKP